MMRRTRKVLCWRCEGVGDLTDQDGRLIFCATCMGMGFLSVSATNMQEEEVDDGWYEDPQPARFSDG